MAKEYSMNEKNESICLTEEEISPLQGEIKLAHDEKERSFSLIRIWLPYLISIISSNISNFVCSKIISSNFSLSYYDAVMISLSLIYSFGNLPCLNLLTTQESLISQALGRKENKECIRIFCINLIFVFLFSLIIAFLFVNGKSFLYLFVEGEDLILLVHRYLLYSIPLILIANLNYSIFSFLTSMHILFIPMILSITVFIFNPVLCYLLVVFFQTGYLGVVFSSLIIESIQFFIFGWIFLFSDSLKEIRVRFNLFVKSSWISFLKLGIPAMIISSLENMSYSILLLSMGRLSEEFIAANFMLNNLYSLVYMIPISIGVSVSTMVGRSLGEGKPKMAISYMISGIVQGEFFSALFLISIWNYKVQIANFVINDSNTIMVFYEGLPYMIMYSLIDPFRTIFQVSLNGMGMQLYSSITGVFTNGILQFTLGYMIIFAFNYFIKGFWITNSISSFICSLILLIVLLRSNFKELSSKICQRRNLD